MCSGSAPSMDETVLRTVADRLEFRATDADYVALSQAYFERPLGSATCASERWRLEQVAARVEAQLAELRRTRRSIRDALAACDQGHCRLSDASAG